MNKNYFIRQLKAAIEALGLDNFRELGTYVCLDLANVYTNKYGKTVNGKILPKVWDVESLEDAAQNLYCWFTGNIDFEQFPNGTVIIAENTLSTRRGMLRHNEKCFSVHWTSIEDF